MANEVVLTPFTIQSYNLEHCLSLFPVLRKD